MCSEFKSILLAAMLVLPSCNLYRKAGQIREGEIRISMSVADERQAAEEPDMPMSVDSIRESLSSGPLIMKAVKDTETGEMVATDVITASRVVARFRNVAERGGYVSVSFDITVPPGMSDSRWQLKILPYMHIQNDTVPLDPVFVTGSAYRERQLRGYERYRRFLESIVTDTSDLFRTGQLEIFLARHFPLTYAMKTDSSVISGQLAENLFGVSQKEAFEHYRRNLKWRVNEARKGRKEEMYERYVKDPVPVSGIRLDTVLAVPGQGLVYRYIHTFRSRPGLRKVGISLEAHMYEDGEKFMELPFPEDITFYISSLSSLTDDRMKYRMLIRQRYVREDTKALIDFAHGSSDIDTSLGSNQSELSRIRECVSDILSNEEYVLDSLVIAASCSPEGSVDFNRRLSSARSEAVGRYVREYMPSSWKDIVKTSSYPENWDRFIRLVENDAVLHADVRNRIVIMCRNRLEDKDALEERLSHLDEYGYLKENIYPKLRYVSFDFHLHRKGVVQDTVFTMEPDTVYLAGVRAIRDMDYRKAVSVLRPYDDYNAALAFMCAGYNHSAADVLDRLDDSTGRVCYLKAMVLARLEEYDQSLKYFRLAVAYDPSLEHRANLDPEMYEIVKLINGER